MLAKDYFPGFSQQKLTVDDGIEINTLVGGNGKEPVLLLHGHPDPYLMWRFIAPKLAEKYTVIATDLRGYGDSSKPQGLPDHANYSKRAMANDQVAVMEQLGFSRFHLAGHDRGARVSHRLIQDYPEKVASCTLLDILPTYDMYRDTNQEFATKYWHWFFYIQPDGLPEKLLAADARSARRPATVSPKTSFRNTAAVSPTPGQSTASAKTTAHRRPSTCSTTWRTATKSSRRRCLPSGARMASSAAYGTCWPAGRSAPPMSAVLPCRTAATSSPKSSRKSCWRPCWTSWRNTRYSRFSCRPTAPTPSWSWARRTRKSKSPATCPGTTVLLK